MLIQAVREKTPLSGRVLTSRSLNHSFDGELRDIYIDKFGERKSLHCVEDLDVATKTFKVLLTLEG